MVVTSEQMRQIEEEAFARGISAEVLMDEAGEKIALAVEQFAPRPGWLLLVLGKGNNAGDALVAARLLREKGWKVGARLAFPADDFKELPRKHWEAIREGTRILDDLAMIEDEPGTMVILDGLLGIGATGVVRSDLAVVIEEVNAFRERRHAMVIALDLPSGLESKTAQGRRGEALVKADVTVTIGLVKASLLDDHATSGVGRLVLAPLTGLQSPPSETEEKWPGDCEKELITARFLLSHLPARNFDFHKGQAGRVGVVAGSKGMLGAAVLSARGALAGGAGLVTVYAPEEIYPWLVGLMPVEVMVKPVKDFTVVLEDRLDALVIGPGLGRSRDAEVLSVLEGSAVPMVVDADALNALAMAGVERILSPAKAPMLLTPHPGEMNRLVASLSEWQGLDRANLAKAFAARFARITLLLKGSRTVVATAGEPLAFNSTGHPGMASGGMGDVLSGVCGALVAAGVEVHLAACIGAWTCGRAAELAIHEGQESAESLTAGAVVNHLGRAFSSLRRLEF